jgi:hypothetical protein
MILQLNGFNPTLEIMMKDKLIQLNSGPIIAELLKKNATASNTLEVKVNAQEVTLFIESSNKTRCQDVPK